MIGFLVGFAAGCLIGAVLVVLAIGVRLALKPWFG